MSFKLALVDVVSIFLCTFAFWLFFITNFVLSVTTSCNWRFSLLQVNLSSVLVTDHQWTEAQGITGCGEGPKEEVHSPKQVRVFHVQYKEIQFLGRLYERAV